MGYTEKPRIDLARKFLPTGLFQALEHIFEAVGEGCTLTGGTALAGFYAGHRRSDDLDLFTRDEIVQKECVLAAKSLKEKDAVILEERLSPYYYHALVTFFGHEFTVDVVQDANFHTAVASELAGRIRVASLEGILMTKIATLVSRCSEKDLYDLHWLLHKFPKLDYGALLEMGRKIDGGVNGESMIFVVSQTRVRKEACGFAEEEGVSSEEVYRRIVTFRKRFLKGLSIFLHEQNSRPVLADIVKVLKG